MNSKVRKRGNRIKHAKRALRELKEAKEKAKPIDKKSAELIKETLESEEGMLAHTIEAFMKGIEELEKKNRKKNK